MTSYTHREVKEVKISTRFLADYMAANPGPKRTILRDQKYRSLRRQVNHKEARQEISKFLTTVPHDTATLSEKAQTIRDRLSVDDFQRSVFDMNADFLDQFVEVYPDFDLPNGDIIPLPLTQSMNLNGVEISRDFLAVTRRVMKSNRQRSGAIALRYSKGKSVKARAAQWQSVIMYGYLDISPLDPATTPESALCLTYDAFDGSTYDAGTKSVSEFNQVVDACQTIADIWPSIEPNENWIIKS